MNLFKTSLIYQGVHNFFVYLPEAHMSDRDM